MMQAFALVCGYISDDDIIYAEESIYLLQLHIPHGVLDEDDYLWDEAERVFSKITDPLESMKTLEFGDGEMAECKLFHREVRQISNTNIELEEKISALPILMSKCVLEFQSDEDFEDYMKANEPSNSNRVLGVKMSCFE